MEIYDFTLKDNSGKDISKKGFEILGFPWNQLENQAPGSTSERSGFCILRHKTTFRQFMKIDANGAHESPW